MVFGTIDETITSWVMNDQKYDLMKLSPEDLLIAGSFGALHRKVAVERRRLEVTLSCIGDAAISTDLKGRVLFLNPTAERATGWTSAEARGTDSEEVFRIVNQKTRVIVVVPRSSAAIARPGSGGRPGEGYGVTASQRK